MSLEIKNIAIAAGGDSSEYEISMESAKQVEISLDPTRYHTRIVEIRKTGWFVHENNGTRYPVNRHDFSYQKNGQATKFDAVFNAIHGTPGENGILQAYFQLLGIPITGCDSFCSSLTFNKFTCNSVLRDAGIPVAKSVLLNRSGKKPIETIESIIGYPCFVKPNNGGSSCGIYKVEKKDELLPALEGAFKEDSQIIVEQFISGREITCGIARIKGKLHVLPITEVISKNEFFDYQAKYNTEYADEITPANIPVRIAEECRNLTQKIYDLLQCKGVVRMDYIFSGSDMWFLEVNTVPGMSDKSIVPQQIRAYGMSTNTFFEDILREALDNNH